MNLLFSNKDVDNLLLARSPSSALSFLEAPKYKIELPGLLVVQNSFRLSYLSADKLEMQKYHLVLPLAMEILYYTRNTCVTGL